MVRHLKYVDIIYCCPVNNCNKEYKTKYNLKKHVEMLHLDRQFFICDLCDKSLSSKQVLDEHMNKHLGIKPFKCTFCYKKFRHYSHLALHRKNHEDLFK